MNNTRNYYETHKRFRETMKKYQAERENALQRIAHFAGSSGYEREHDIIEGDFRSKVNALQTQARHDFNTALRGMQDNAEKQKPLAPPTPEQEALLRILKMRENLKLNELEEASRFCKDNVLALRVIDEIAKQHNYVTYYADPPTVDAIKALAHFASTTVSMPMVDNREGWINGEERRVDYFSIDKDFENENDCIAFAGGISDTTSFCELVND